MNFPTLLTLTRILLIPIFIVMFYLPVSWAYIVTAAVFCIAAITDWLDGYLARSWSQTSQLGAFLDPVADKLVIVIALVLLVAEYHYSYLAVPAAVIIGREIVVSALREWMAELGKRTSVAVSHVGKFKTAVQMIAVILMLVGRGADGMIFNLSAILGIIMLYVAAILTLWSMIMYLQAAWGEFRARA